ncbi:MAG: cytochrome c-type biogenesis protein [Pseudomonadota bacterium]|nr:cytochrome c-type biogenesis protein [Candidatus Acidoferrales bacterium]
MKQAVRAIVMTLLAIVGGPAVAVTPQRFEDPAQQRQYEQLLPELRCLVCQNETLAESEAPLADDLRREVAELIRRGESDAEIRAFLVARYGDFVLYRPPVKTLTYALWLGPFALLLVGVGVWFAVARRQRRMGAAAPVLSADEQHRVRALLERDEDKSP